MSRLGRGEDDLHYEDNSHRWISPDPKIEQENWEAVVRAHLAQHLLDMDVPGGRRIAVPPPTFVRRPRRSRKTPRGQSEPKDAGRGRAE